MKKILNLQFLVIIHHFDQNPYKKFTGNSHILPKLL